MAGLYHCPEGEVDRSLAATTLERNVVGLISSPPAAVPAVQWADTLYVASFSMHPLSVI